jgi:hypothetical protein
VDQAFAPGTSDFDVLARDALALRRPDGQTAPTTNILSTSGTLEGFMRELPTSPLRVPRPVPEIILLSHASETGWLEMSLTDEERNEHQYETLTRVGTALNIPDEVLKDAGGALHPAIVRVRGCRIGIARPFLRKFKDALKNVSTLIAPRHFQAASTWRNEAGATIGRMEFLMYCFESYPNRPVRPQPKSTPRQSIIDTFKADQHVRADGSVVSEVQWGKWLDQANAPKKNVEFGNKYEKRLGVPVRLPATWGVSPSEGDLTNCLNFQHFIATNNGPWEIGGENLASKSADERRNFIKTTLRNPATKAKFAVCFEDHQWSIWQRYLKIRYETFTSFDDFLAGFDWVFESGSWYGMRHVYRLLVPITDPVDSNILLANFYPLGPTAAHTKLDERDNQYFAAV